MNLYSVYDEVAQTFNAPFPEANHNSALRSFGLACSDPQTILSKHPGDYYLYFLGELDVHTGEISTVLPDRLARGTDFKEVE